MHRFPVVDCFSLLARGQEKIRRDKKNKKIKASKKMNC